jgi:hypothetical protein
MHRTANRCETRVSALCRYQVQKEGEMDDAISKALQERRKKEIEKLERDLTFMEEQRKAFEAEGLNNDKAEVLRDGINGARNALDVFRSTYERALPLQSWEGK